jgi:hypothetical protein
MWRALSYTNDAVIRTQLFEHEGCGGQMWDDGLLIAEPFDAPGDYDPSWGEEVGACVEPCRKGKTTAPTGAVIPLRKIGVDK